jgi:hypothetical protein
MGVSAFLISAEGDGARRLYELRGASDRDSTAMNVG